jgi:riboflavin kinase/FMN adenylyltransferase
MEYVRGLQGLEEKHRGAAITVGSFDGIHLGHGALIASTCGIAKQLAKPAMMLTFEPMPREYLASQAKPPQEPPARLTDFRERWRVLERSDLHYVCVLRFDEKLRQLTGEQFVDLLQTRFGASAVVVGQDFRFGRGGAGSVALLRAAAEAGAFELELVPSVGSEDVRVSSSGVRAALAAADFERARDLLGRAYSMRGRVVAGEQLGRRLGYPTANLPLRRPPPLSGIFAVRVHGLGAPRVGVASLGVRPTIEPQGKPILEVFLFDFEDSIYGHRITVEFLHKLRDEEKYDTLAALTDQIRADVAQAKEYFEAEAPV